MSKRKLNDSEKKVLTFWAILAVIIVIGLFIFRIVAPEKFDKFFGLDGAERYYSLVTDRTRYYTVANAIDKYYSYTNAKDANAIFNMLNENYKQSKNIKFASDINFTQEVDPANLTFNPRLMCKKKIAKAKYSFLVKGFESKSTESKRLGTLYYQVILDDSNFTFSIQPIDEKTFGGECHE